jgi:hypothetical protein
MRLGGDACQYYQNGFPFVTSVGRVTPLFAQILEDDGKSWTVTDIANSFTGMTYRPAALFWEWQGRTTVRIVGCEELDRNHPLKGIKDDMARFIKDLLS